MRSAQFCLTWFTALAGLLAAPATFAHAGHVAELEKRFAEADTNRDGQLSLAEAQARMPRVAAKFSQFDKTGKGHLTLDELKRALVRHDAPAAPASAAVKGR